MEVSMSDYGMILVSRTTTRFGMNYYRFWYEGSPDCQVTSNLTSEGDRAYIRLNKNKLYFGPFLLDVVEIQFAGGKPFYYFTRRSNNLHNKIVPHLYPLYVVWVEFWRWVLKYER